MLSDHSTAVLYAAHNHCSALSLILSVREEWRGPADTQHPPIRRYPHPLTNIHAHINKHSNKHSHTRATQGNRQPRRADTHMWIGQLAWLGMGDGLGFGAC